MRLYIIKIKGANVWQNLLLENKLVYENGDIIHCDNVFFRKKDANRHLQCFEYKEFFEVKGLTIDK
jgi:hypothetical protein